MYIKESNLFWNLINGIQFIVSNKNLYIQIIETLYDDVLWNYGPIIHQLLYISVFEVCLSKRKKDEEK